jgi:hypothetical protein
MDMPTSLAVVDLEEVDSEGEDGKADDRQDKAWIDDSRRTGCETISKAAMMTSSGGML